MRDSDSDILSEVEGKPVHAYGQMLQSSSWGKTRLELHKTRLVEHTKHVIAQTQSEILLAELQGAAYAVRGNPLLLALGFATIAIGIGLIFILLYFVGFRKRFLIFHGGTFTQHVTVQGDPGPYLDFMEDVLAQAEKVKKNIGSGPVSGSSAAPSSATAQRSSGEGAVMNCPSCNMEFRLPPGSGGKKFRCSGCKGVMQAPAGV